MGTLNTEHNRACWFDIPVADLDRAVQFYAAVLGVGVTKEQFGEIEFGVIAHDEGNGGCLVIAPDQISESGLLIYLNVNGRIKDAVAQCEAQGGRIIEPTHSIALMVFEPSFTTVKAIEWHCTLSLTPETLRLSSHQGHHDGRTRFPETHQEQPGRRRAAAAAGGLV